MRMNEAPASDSLDPASVLRPDIRAPHDLYESDTGRSNFVAFLLGGVVISGGLLAFLYLDSDHLGARDVMTTGSLGRIEMPAARTAPPPATLAPSGGR